jgi:hypothetical protein
VISVAFQQKPWVRWTALFIFQLWIVFFSGIVPQLSPSENSRPAFYNDPDKTLNACILQWNLKTLERKWDVPISDAPIFFPCRYAKFFSEHLLAHMIYAFPVSLFGASPQTVYNMTYQLNRLTIAIAASLLCLEIGSTFLPALIAGALLITSWNFGQIQNTGLCWVLLTILFFIRQLKIPRWSNALAIAFFGSLTGLSSGYLAFYTPLALLLLLIVRIIYIKKWPGSNWARQIGVAMILISLALTPTMMSYKSVQKKYGLVRQELHAAALILPFVKDQAEEKSVERVDKIAFTFSACAEVLLFACAFVIILRRRLNFDGWEWAFATLAILSFWMALFEFSPYYLIARLPGFNGLRAAYRWYFIGITGLTVVISMVITAASKKWSTVMKLLLIAACLTLLIYAAIPVSIPRYPDRMPESKVYSFLATLESRPVCILPIQPRGKFLFRIANADRMLYQLSYSFPMVSGYSGFVPPLTRFIEHKLINKGLSQPVIAKLARTGVKYIVVDNLLGDTSEILSQLRSQRICKIIYDKDGEMVAELPVMDPERDMKNLTEMWSQADARQNP